MIRKKSEDNNLAIAITVLYAKKRKIYMSCLRFETNSKREKQLIRLMISNEEGWHYITVKKLYVLSREILLKPKT